MKKLTVQGNQIDHVRVEMDGRSTSLILTCGCTIVSAVWYDTNQSNPTLWALQEAYISQSPEPITVELP